MTTAHNADLAGRLAAARERTGFSQDEVGALVGQPRTVISNWESAARRPNGQQLQKLASIYRTPVDELLGSIERPRPNFEQLLFRDAGDRLDTLAKYEVQRFIGFLDLYAAFLEDLDEPPGLQNSPFRLVEGFSSKDDLRRKAQEARDFFRIGSGPVGDLIGLADLLGITVYQAALGTDLKCSISGAFIPHDRVGFSILLNSETTPGRRLFTLAHEIGHALFHGDHMYVAYYGRKESSERFADAFASEFLVPSSSLRAAVEAVGTNRVRDPEEVVHIQRLFKVSYSMILVRLRSSGLLEEKDLERLRTVRPVHLADRLGYSTQWDEWSQDPHRWGLARFPQRFLRLMRRALEDGRMSPSGAAAMTELSEEDIEEFLRDESPPKQEEEEFEYLRASG